MVAHLRKARKLRGHVSHGEGRIGKNRKHSGGRGACGGLTHLRTLFMRTHPGYFGKIGMRVFHKNTNGNWKSSINLDKTLSLLTENSRKLYLEKKEKVPVIDVTKAGYFKVLGKGVLSHPVVIKAKFFSKSAERKIKAAGGACVLIA